MTTTRTLLFAILLCVTATAYAVDLWGKVIWNTGAPAVGIELRLQKSGIPDVTGIFTNGAGRYGLYGLSVPTSEYTLTVLSRGKVLKTVTLPRLRTGDRVPDIVMP